ncbi:MAG: hypothetical protein HN403_18295 [Rhodospirillales bacterium]|jgi:hypothetical protein|nr:hypothetical protein [Rhodospirillales bacterium]
MTDDKKQRNPKWLKEVADEALANDILKENRSIKTVGDHLINHSSRPLPSDLLNVLDHWLRDFNHVRIEGRRSRECYSLADRLVENGFSIEFACEKAKLHFGVGTDIDNLIRRYKDFRSKRNDEEKELEALVREISSDR